MKHVWILNHYAREPGDSGNTRHLSMARHLHNHGWKTSIIAASTDHRTGGQRFDEHETKRLRSFDGVNVLRVRTAAYSGNGVGRIRNMVDFAREVLKRENLSDLERPDAVIGSTVHPLAAWAGRRLARRYDVPFLFEVRDLWPQTLIDMGYISCNHPAAVGLHWLERSLYRDACRIIVLLPKAGDYIEPLGVKPERIVWIPNGVDLDSFPPSPPSVEAKTFSLIYFGAHGEANGLDNLLRAMRIIKDDPNGQHIELRLIGEGPAKSSLIKIAHDLNLQNIRFEAPVPKVKIPKLAGEADALVFNLKDVAVFKYGISPNKLFDYMAAQRPVLFCCDAANNPIAEAGAGITVPPENPEALASATMRIASLPLSERNKMGKAGRKHLEENYSMKMLAGRLACALDECVQAP